MSFVIKLEMGEPGKEGFRLTNENLDLGHFTLSSLISKFSLMNIYHAYLVAVRSVKTN